MIISKDPHKTANQRGVLTIEQNNYLYRLQMKKLLPVTRRIMENIREILNYVKKEV